MSSKPLWYIYLIRCANGDLYTGISTDVERRFHEHAKNKGAKRLRGQGPLELMFSASVGDRSSAQKMEFQIKKLSRQKKEALIKGKMALPALIP